MFQIEKEQYVNKTFRLNARLYEELAACATQGNISVNALIVQCCRYALEDLHPVNGEDQAKK